MDLALSLIIIIVGGIIQIGLFFVICTCSIGLVGAGELDKSNLFVPLLTHLTMGSYILLFLSPFIAFINLLYQATEPFSWLGILWPNLGTVILLLVFVFCISVADWLRV